MLRVITDFDGPIMNVSPRYYKAYEFCLEQIKFSDQVVNKLSLDEFWKLKRKRVAEKEIGLISGLAEDQARDFADLRKNTVHSMPYFQYDEIWPSAIGNLERLQDARIDLVVLTMRKVRELKVAFDRYDLGRFFGADRCYCLSDDYVKTKDTEDKPKLIERALSNLPLMEKTWVIGDTEADILAAKKVNLPVIGVLSGIRDAESLAQYDPDLILDDLGAVVDFMLSN